MRFDRFSSISGGLLPWMLDYAAKGAVIALLSLILMWWMRRASAATRHLVLFLGITSVLLLPVLSAVLPAWSILPAWGGPEPFVTEQSPASVPAQGIEPGEGSIIPDNRLEHPFAPSIAMPAPAKAAPVAPAVRPIASPPSPAAKTTFSLNWQPCAMIVWMLGSTIYCCYLFIACGSLYRLSRRSPTVASETWVSLMNEAQVQMNYRRPAKLIAGRRRAMPMTWGIFHTSVLLPAGASQWTAAQFRAVLLHELAHARRRDCLTQLIAQFAVAVYWFNPLIWLVGWRMQTEREKACDDLVLSTGAKASAYAEQLLMVAAEMPAMRSSAAAIAMARKGCLEGRLLAILDVKRNRRAMTWTAGVAALVLMAAIAAPLAMLRAQVEAPAKAIVNTAPVKAGEAKASRETGQPALPAATESSKPDASKLLDSAKTVDSPPHPDLKPATQPAAPAAPAARAAESPEDREALYQKIAEIDPTMAKFLRFRENELLALENMKVYLGPKHPRIIQAQTQYAASQRRVGHYADQVLLMNPDLVALPQVLPATLDFRIAGRVDPKIAAPAGNRLPPAVAQQYISDLEKNGPHQVVGFDWFEAGKASLYPPNIFGTHDGKRYVLLATTDPCTMLAERNGRRTWGLKHVDLGKDSDGGHAVTLEFDSSGAKRFGKLTEANIKQPLAFLVDGKVLWIATIEAKLGRSVMMSPGNDFDPATARRTVQSLTLGMPQATQPATSAATQPATSGFPAN